MSQKTSHAHSTYVCMYISPSRISAHMYGILVVIVLHGVTCSSRTSKRSFDRSQSMMPSASSNKKMINTPTIPHTVPFTVGMKPPAEDK